MDLARPVEPETDLERAIVADDRWKTGAAWGEPRPGHPEGRVDLHIGDVLANIDKLGLNAEARRKLRLIALVHDTFKNEVDNSQPRTGANHHATIARGFVERFTDDRDVLEITELHDEAYNSWAVGIRRGDWEKANARVDRLLQRLGSRRDLYLAFYRADNSTGDKWSDPLDWFEKRIAELPG